MKKLVVSLLLPGVLSISASIQTSFADADTKPDLPSQEQQVAESYALPITPPLHQGDTGLCWMYATLSMLETNYLSRHPGSKISLSRGAMQVEAVEDRLERLVRGKSTRLPEGGLAVEALTLIRKDGIVAQPDFRDIVDSNPIAKSIEQDLARITDRAAKEKALSEELHEKLGVVPGGHPSRWSGGERGADGQCGYGGIRMERVRPVPGRFRGLGPLPRSGRPSGDASQIREARCPDRPHPPVPGARAGRGVGVSRSRPADLWRRL